MNVAPSGAEANDISWVVSIAAGGRQVTFGSQASNLVPGDTNRAQDVFLHDRASGTTTRVCVDSSGAEAGAGSFGGEISADGRYTAFDSHARDLVEGDTNGASDVFVRGCDAVGISYCLATTNSTGAPAAIGASCSSSASAGTLELEALPVPAQFGIFFHGPIRPRSRSGTAICASPVAWCAAR